MSVSANSKLKSTRGLSSYTHGADLKIFVKDVADKQNRKRALTVRTWSTIKDVKDVLQQHLHVPPSSQRLYYGPLMTSGGELPNHRTLHDAGIYRSGETLLLEISNHSSLGLSGTPSSISSLKATGDNDLCVSSSLLDLTPKAFRRTLQQARRGLAMGLKPVLVLDGSGGTYFLHDARKRKIGVFKPGDEEPYAENNPRGYVPTSATNDFGEDSSMRSGIKPGEACLREVAAFLLDHGHFASVPMTTLIEARHSAFNSNGSMWKLSEGGAAVGNHRLLSASASSSKQILPKKVGSCQEYVNAECSMDDLSPSKISVDEVHKIAILDIRIMNADRNSANLLCRRKPSDPDHFELIPIDHGYCLRTVNDVCWFDWCWLDWPQLKKPLSKTNRDYVLSLNIEADVRLLKERLHIPTEALDLFRASCKLLQAGVKAGMTLYDIAVMCCRNDDAGELPSKLETLIKRSQEIATLAVHNGRWHHAAASRALAEQLSPDNSHQHSFRNPATINASKSWMIKSASSVNFSSFQSDKSSSSRNNPPTPMAPSSGSDTSSDGGDPVAEREECEEWAAAVIADVKLEKDAIPPTPSRRQRAISVASSESSNNSDSDSQGSWSNHKLSSSPVGFWYVPPNSSKEAPEDTEDYTWSPHLSPRITPSPLEVDGLEHEMGSMDLGKVPEVDFYYSPNILLPPRSSMENLDPPIKVNGIAEDGDDISSLLKKSIKGGAGLKTMQRSLSYSAFSFKSISGSPVSTENNSRAGPSSNTENEHYRVYFLKFIDLLITQETCNRSFVSPSS